METCLTISLMFLLMTADVDGQQDWRVNYNPSSVCALRGSTVRMFYTHGYQIISSYWTKTPHTPNLCSDGKYREKIQCHTNSITLTHVTEADEGVYYCRFTDEHRNVYRGTPGVQLDVTDLQVETQQRVKEGDSVTLTCKTTCRLTEETTFIWYRNTQILTKGRFTENEFHLQSVRRHDSGLYRCAAERGSEHLSSPGVYLNVEYPPEKTSASISSSGVIVEGDSVNLTCSSESNPPVHIYSWFKGKTFVGSGNIYSITNIRSDHSGEYKCKTKNEHGEKYSEAVMLNVTYAPRNVSASISSSGDSVNPPVHIYSWFKENQTSSVGSGQTYSISNINSSLSGWFYCVAQNDVGSQRSAAVSLSVKGVQGSAGVFGIVAGCGGLFFIIIIFIILFIWKKKRERQNQNNHFNGSDSANDVPLYAQVSANQREASEPDADVQYSSVQHIRNKEMKSSHHISHHHSPDVIYSSVN